MKHLVTTSETSKSLFETGFPQQSLHYWHFHEPDRATWLNQSSAILSDEDYEYAWAAPTAQEIADQLPNSRDGHYLHITPYGSCWYASYYEIAKYVCHDEQVADTMVEALALLWLKVNGVQS